MSVCPRRRAPAGVTAFLHSDPQTRTRSSSDLDFLRTEILAGRLLRGGMGVATGDDRHRAVPSLSRCSQRMAAADIFRARRRLDPLPADWASDFAGLAPAPTCRLRSPVQTDPRSAGGR